MSFAAGEFCSKQAGFVHLAIVPAHPGHAPERKAPDLDKNPFSRYTLRHETALQNDLLGRVPQPPEKRVHANKSFSEFVSEIRIGHACKLFIEKKWSVSQACYDSGYRALSNFNRQFKALTRQTPSAYKREYEKNKNQAI
jgi:AraC-like DNA-binding protein